MGGGGWHKAKCVCGGGGYTQRGRLWTACGQRRVDSKNSQTTPATTSTSSICQLLGAADAQTAHRATFSTAQTPTTGLREGGNDTSKSTGCSGRQRAATRRNMRREERVTVQGPVKKHQPDGMSHRGGGLTVRTARRAARDRGQCCSRPSQRQPLSGQLQFADLPTNEHLLTFSCGVGRDGCSNKTRLKLNCL